MNSTESTKLLVLKLSKNVVEKEHKGLGGEDIGVPGLLSRMQSKKFNNDTASQNNRNGTNATARAKSRSGTAGSQH